MIKLNDDLLQELGLGALPPEEKKKLLAHIYETLEMRVGMKLAEQMTDAQLDEFEQFITRNDEAGALAWLESNFPNYKDVVAAEFEKLKGEIRQVAPQILASALPGGQASQPQQQYQPYPQPPVQPMQPQPQQSAWSSPQPVWGQQPQPPAGQSPSYPQQPPLPPNQGQFQQPYVPQPPTPTPSNGVYPTAQPQQPTPPLPPSHQPQQPQNTGTQNDYDLAA